MYINKIDDLIDKIMDEFYSSIILKNDLIKKIYNEKTCIKYQREINNLLVEYFKTINFTEINELVKNNESSHTVIETIKRYITIYFFLTLGFYYKEKDDMFINSIIEFSQNQLGYDLKIDNFFNSESNSLIVKYYFIVKNILQILNSDQQKLEILKKKHDIIEVVNLFKKHSLTKEFIDNVFRLNDKITVNIQCHNIIKTLIILELYKSNERNDFFAILEMTENLEGEYTFIDIVVPTQKTLDYESIESVLEKKDILNGMATKLWKFLQDHLNKTTFIDTQKSVEQKIIDLIESGIVCPICDDFLLYHKQSEKYDRHEEDSIKKKEDTKIKYIVNKIDFSSKLYSDSSKSDSNIHDNIKKHFSVPLMDKKAILVNNEEDIKIINKYTKFGKKSVEINDFYQDLINYKSYPYINFKEFEKNGFSISVNDTVNVLRYVSVSKTGDFRQTDNNYIQTRSGSSFMVLNVVGFLIPTNTKGLNCIKTKELINITELIPGKKNGVELATEFLQDTGKHDSSVYWIFNPEYDKIKMDTYEQSANFSSSEQIKIIVSKLYDNIVLELYDQILEKIEKIKPLNLNSAYKILEKAKKSKLNIHEKSELYTKLEYKIFELLENVTVTYDKESDILYGISGDIVELYKYKRNIEEEILSVTINTNSVKIQNKYSIDDDYENISSSTCQHNISQERIINLQKTNPGKYSDAMFEFTQQYVTENGEHEYMCKSCSSLLNIKKYVPDGSFNDITGQYIAFATPLDIQLEDIEEYDKYKNILRGVDKFIDKIANISGIQYYTGVTYTSKSRRKTLVKDTIDLILLNNQSFKKIYDERNAEATKLYNINRNLSEFYVFSLDNNVFVYSSKDKDQYKPTKMNNIITYILILLILDINENQLMYIGNNKKGVCNFSFFTKLYSTFFGSLKIIINDANDVDFITNYKVLCYIIYILSCVTSQYIWYYELEDPTKRKSHLPVIQKTVIHTIVDMFNGIIEMSKTNNNRLYEILMTKYFKKLKMFYKNDEIYLRLENNFRTLTLNNVNVKELNKNDHKKLSGKYMEQEFNNTSYASYIHPKILISSRQHKYIKPDIMTNLTNCVDGKFHKWSVINGKYNNWTVKPEDNILKCVHCGVKITEINLSKDVEQSIYKNYKFTRLKEISTRICSFDGSNHLFVYENIKGEFRICSKCKKYENHEYLKDELLELEKSIEIYNINNIKEQINNMNVIKNNDFYYDNEYKTLLKNIENEYKNTKNNDDNSFINELIEEIYSIVGNDSSSKDMFLKDNAYIINHDQYGSKLDKPVVLTDRDNKIYYKNNHPFFNTDVIYYSTYKNGKIDIFYDASTKLLLGYKEESKNFVNQKNKDKENKLIINYSLLNKLKYMGYTNQFINIKEKYDNIKSGQDELEIDVIELTKNIFNQIMEERLNNLKKLIVEFQRILYNMLFEKTGELNTIGGEESEYFDDKFKSLIFKYSKKINDFTDSDKHGQNNIFGNWNIVKDSILPKQIMTDLNFDIDNNKIINVSYINKLDTQGNLLLFYIVKEFIKMFKYNENKFLKMELINFLYEFIDILYNYFNEDKIMENINIKGILYLVRSTTYKDELINIDKSLINVITGEYIDNSQPVTEEEVEALEDMKEEAESLDIEGDESDDI